VNSWSVISEPLASDKAFITSIDIVAPVVAPTSNTTEFPLVAVYSSGDSFTPL